MTVIEKPAEEMVLGVPVTCFASPGDAAAYVIQTIKKKEKTYCVAINPEKVWLARRDVAFHNIVKEATFHICDGVGAAAAVRILGGVKIPRVTGIELFLRLLALAEEARLTVFLLGGERATIEQAHDRMRRTYPHLRCAGYRDGYFREDESPSIVKGINGSKADILFVALGSPKQERWIAKYRGQLKTPLCMGGGGSRDVLGGRVKRAPRVFRATGTEWLYRLAKQPSRWRRQLALPRFALDVLIQKWGRHDWASKP